MNYTQDELSAWEGHGTIHAQCYHTACARQPGVRPSQDGFRKDKSCLTNLISFHNRVTCLVDEEKAVDVIFYLDFSTISHNIFLGGKLAA